MSSFRNFALFVCNVILFFSCAVSSDFLGVKGSGSPQILSKETHQATYPDFRDEENVFFVLGNSGVGKTSLINFLSNASASTDSKKCCTTTDFTIFKAIDFDQSVLSFIDSPGVDCSEGCFEKSLSRSASVVNRSCRGFLVVLKFLQ